MVNYAWTKRLRGKQYKRRHRPRRTLGRPNNIWTVRDQVGIKRLYRGPQIGQKPVSVIGQFIDNKRTNYGKHTSLRGANKVYKKTKKQKLVKNSFKSEL